MKWTHVAIVFFYALSAQCASVHAQIQSTTASVSIHEVTVNSTTQFQLTIQSPSFIWYINVSLIGYCTLIINKVVLI